MDTCNTKMFTILFSFLISEIIYKSVNNAKCQIVLVLHIGQDQPLTTAASISAVSFTCTSNVTYLKFSWYMKSEDEVNVIDFTLIINKHDLNIFKTDPINIANEEMHDWSATKMVDI